MIKYDRLWKKMDEKGISQYRLIKEGISPSSLDRLKKNDTIRTDTLSKLCSILDCKLEDIAEYKADKN